MHKADIRRLEKERAKVLIAKAINEAERDTLPADDGKEQPDKLKLIVS